MGLAFLQDQIQELVPQLAFVQRVSNPPVFAGVSAERSLKVLVYKAPD
ncbi:MAG: class I SAM-dependent methyltransferase [Hylemonella sp.]|nr:class I SAM-dependent methyltransferase [Hylemonella sp.]MDP1938160.1 class I SAM-dependent methyltransferase [Hylemonella sp.]